MIDFVCVPSWYTHCFLRACVFSRLSRSFFLSHHSHKQTNFEQSFLFNENTRVSSSKSVKSLINYLKSFGLAVLSSKEKPDFSRHTDFGSHLFFFVFFLSFFLFERFLFERERTFLRFRARESKSAQKNTERDLFLIRKCPPRNKNGNKMKRLS